MVVDEQDIAGEKDSFIRDLDDDVTIGVRRSDHYQRDDRSDSDAEFQFSGERPRGGTQRDAGEVEITEITAKATTERIFRSVWEIRVMISCGEISSTMPRAVASEPMMTASGKSSFPQQ